MAAITISEEMEAGDHHNFFCWLARDDIVKDTTTARNKISMKPLNSGCGHSFVAKSKETQCPANIIPKFQYNKSIKFWGPTTVKYHLNYFVIYLFGKK